MEERHGSAPADVTIEVCVTSLASARTAAAAGAHRLELCTALPLGGLTPSVGLVGCVLEAVEIPVIVLIRPREGGFRYHDDEIAVARADIARLSKVRSSRGNAVAGFAIGALTDEGTLDTKAIARMIEAIDPADTPAREWCLHRAFDHVRDPSGALEQAIDLGLDRILTSGCAADVTAGLPTITACVERAAGRIEILPGGGVNAGNAAEIVRMSGVRSLHLSAARWVPEAMRFRREGISLGAGAAPDETRHLETDEERLRALFATLAPDA